MENKFHHFALISRLAYSDLDKAVRAEFKKLGYTTVKFIDIDGAQAYVLTNKERVVVAFRGTEVTEKSDIAADLEFFHSNGFHRGFLEEYEKLDVDVIGEVAKQLGRKKRPVYVTGHSLGAAIASIFCYNFTDVEALYTYGCPRNTSWSKAKKLTVPHYRCVNNNDIVPTVPPRIFNYAHHGEEVYFNYFGAVRKLSWWQRIKDKWRGHKRAWQKKEPFDSIRDHSMDQYVQHCEACEKPNE